MNLRTSHPGKVDVDTVAEDLKRIEALWSDQLDRSGGPYLLGEFSAADAMHAPVATVFARTSCRPPTRCRNMSK